MGVARNLFATIISNNAQKIYFYINYSFLCKNPKISVLKKENHERFMHPVGGRGGGICIF